MRGEVGDLRGGEELAPAVSVEKQQEQQLMNKLAATGKLPARPQSSFLQKRLQQRKFFDSGDYNMDKDKQATGGEQGGKPHPLTVTPSVVKVGETEPAAAATGAAAPAESADLLIPRPDTVPQRKASIINPGMHSKLSPQPHLHHEHHDEQ